MTMVSVQELLEMAPDIPVDDQRLIFEGRSIGRSPRTIAGEGHSRHTHICTQKRIVEFLHPYRFSFLTLAEWTKRLGGWFITSLF